MYPAKRASSQIPLMSKCPAQWCHSAASFTQPGFGKCEKSHFCWEPGKGAGQTWERSERGAEAAGLGKERTFSEPGLLQLPQVSEELWGDIRGTLGDIRGATAGTGGGCPVTPGPAQPPLTFRVLLRLPGSAPSAQHGSGPGQRRARGLLREERVRGRSPARAEPARSPARSCHSPAGR